MATVSVLIVMVIAAAFFALQLTRGKTSEESEA